jgi:hypothetical protein
MAILVIGCILTMASWIVAWGRFGILTELSFFPLWLGYILTVNGLTEIVTGTSLLTRMRRSFGWLFVISVPFWWFFEGMNEIVQNWHYQFPQPVSSTRYFIQSSMDFSTVVPAALSTSLFAFQLVMRRRAAPAPGARVKRPHLAILSLLGTLSFSLLALFPEQAFPLVWIAPILVFEPIAHAIDCPSLLTDVQRRDPALIVSIMVGTLFTGIWWELWNYYSLPKWTYTVPYVGFWKMFEMPIIGYLGYPFFGLIVFSYTGIMLMLITGERLDEIFRSPP